MRNALLLSLALFAAAPAAAQDRTRSGRARLELSFDHGPGFGTEGAYGELAADLRVVAPFGLGLVLRTGGASNGPSNAIAVDLGVAQRFDLVESAHAGLQLGLALGPSFAYGPFDQGYVEAFGGFAMAHLDFWYRSFFVGIGVVGHVLGTVRGEDPELTEQARRAPIATAAPILRIGGDWGL